MNIQTAYSKKRNALKNSIIINIYITIRQCMHYMCTLNALHFQQDEDTMYSTCTCSLPLFLELQRLPCLHLPQCLPQCQSVHEGRSLQRLPSVLLSRVVQGDRVIRLIPQLRRVPKGPLNRPVPVALVHRVNQATHHRQVGLDFQLGPLDREHREDPSNYSNNYKENVSLLQVVLQVLVVQYYQVLQGFLVVLGIHQVQVVLLVHWVLELRLSLQFLVHRQIPTH